MSTTKGSKPVVYIAGRYSNGDTASKETRDRNRIIFMEAFIRLTKLGMAVINPIANDAYCVESNTLTYEEILDSDFSLIARCDYIYMLKGWELGKGSVAEHEFAKERGITILYEVDSVVLHT